MRINNHVVYTLYTGYYYWGIFTKFKKENSDYNIVKANLTMDEAMNFAGVMNKIKETR